MTSMVRDLVGIVNQLRTDQRQVMTAMQDMKVELEKQGQEVSRWESGLHSPAWQSDRVVLQSWPELTQ